MCVWGFSIQYILVCMCAWWFSMHVCIRTYVYACVLWCCLTFELSNCTCVYWYFYMNFSIHVRHCTYVCVYAVWPSSSDTYECMYVCMYVCMHVCIYTYIHMYVCVFVCLCVCIHMCVCVCVCIHTYIHTYIRLDKYIHAWLGRVQAKHSQYTNHSLSTTSKARPSM
jgi:hypothetical protein